jgi:hypothetical protein
MIDCEEQFGGAADGEPYEVKAALWNMMSPEARDNFVRQLARMVAPQRGLKDEFVEDGLVSSFLCKGFGFYVCYCLPQPLFSQAP